MPAPRAPRLRRPGWRDPRLLLGVALVGLSALLGSWAVGSAGRTAPVLVAREALVPGEALRAEMLRTVDVRLPEDGAQYLPADVDLAELVVTRVVREGELVPSSAVASAGDAATRAVAVTTGAEVSSAVVEGSLVDLWFVPETPLGGAASPAPPRQLAAALTVAEVGAATSTFSVGPGATVHVLVPLDDLPEVLAAVRGAGTVELVPVPGGTR
ncbi:MAG: SAF domain-containing protein [Actinotalea sp.]|nr:SAF domain-containing protein [Actinotalea sp.]